MCFGLAADTALEATLTYHAPIDDLLNGSGAGILVADSGLFQAHLSQLPQSDSQFVRWAGTMDGTSTAWIHQLYIANGSDTTALDYAGSVYVGDPHDSNSAIGLVLDVRQCRYRLVGSAWVNAHWTVPGNSFDMASPVMRVQFVGPVPTGAAASGFTRRSDSLPSHSVYWLQQHTDSSALAPLGIVMALFAGTTDEYPVSGATGGFQLRKSP